MSAHLSESSAKRRFEVFAPFVSGGRGLEIGPAAMPIVPKSAGFDTLVLDHCDKAQLAEHYRANGATPEQISRIEDVDFVVPDGRSYVDAAGSAQFDHVIACHVIEHSPDLVGFLEACATMLRPNGHLLLAVPTRELSFDFFRPLTTLGDVLVGHLDPALHALRSRIDELTLDASIDGERAWIPETLEVHLRSGRLPDAPGPGQVDTSMIDGVISDRESDPFGVSGWFGHRWVFEPGQFVWLFESIRNLFSVPLRIERLEGGIGSEFLVILSREAESQNCFPGVSAAPSEAARSVLASRSPVLPPGHASVYASMAPEGWRANDAVARQLEHKGKEVVHVEESLERVLRRRSVRTALAIVHRAQHLRSLLPRRGIDRAR